MVDPNTSQISTAVFDEVTAKIYDNFTNNNAFMAELKAKGNISEDYTGGEFIRQNLAYAENTSYKHYRGSEKLNISEADVISAAKYDIKQIAMAISMTGLEEIMNAGEAKIIDLYQTKSMVLKNTFANNFEKDILSPGTLSGGKQIGGLALLVANNPSSGFVGGINSANFAWWRNVSYSATGVGGGAVSPTNIKKMFDDIFRQTTRGTDRPDFIIADDVVYGAYESFVTPLGSMMDPMANKQGAGAETLVYKGRKVALGGGRGGSMPASTCYFLNTDYIKLKEAKNRKLKMRDAVKALDADVEVSLALWAGNLVVSNRFVHAVLIP